MRLFYPVISIVLLSLLTTNSCWGQIEISNDQVKVVVDIENGGRIVEYSLNGKNALHHYSKQEQGLWNSYGPDAGRFDFGPEKLVPSRNETWIGAWELVKQTEDCIKIRSQVAKEAGVRLYREFRLDKNSSHLKFTQTIQNVSKEAKRYCHWSRTFGEANGICLAPLNGNSRFPKGYMVYGNGDMLDYSPKGGKNVEVKDGVLLIYGPPEFAKFVTDDNNGWLAYITRGNQLFVKKFEVFEDKVYGEMTGATVSIWYSKEGICEIEPIGPWEWIKPGKSISFTENWYLMDYKYPEDRNVDLNSVKLIIDGL